MGTFTMGTLPDSLLSEYNIIITFDIADNDAGPFGGKRCQLFENEETSEYHVGIPSKL